MASGKRDLLEARGQMKRILIVEDEEGIRDSLTLAFEGEGFVVHVASDGSAALTMLDSIPPPDIIVTDIQMHPMDGKAFLKWKNQSPLLKNIPVLVVTANPDTRDIEELVIKKPFQLDQILHAVEVLTIKSTAIEPRKMTGVS